MHTRLIPQIFTCYRSGYSLKHFANDLIAGLITGIVALPLAIAFGIASGVTPEQGLYTAIVAGFLISFFSGSRVQIGGPTGAFIVIVYGIVQQYGTAGLTVATLMAGIMLILMGICRLGSVLKYLPYPLIVGFTTGIAVIIAVTQIPAFLGMKLEEFPGEFIGKLEAIGTHLHQIDPLSAGLGLLALLIMIIWPRVTRRIPGSLVAILVTTVLVSLLKLPVETIGSRFGGVPDHLPALKIPAMDLSLMRELFQPALTIALLAAIESLLSAVVADGMTGQKHRSNMELIAQGIANLVAPLFGGIPATGAIARTATNIKNGGTTPLAGIVHAATLALILLFFGTASLPHILIRYYTVPSQRDARKSTIVAIAGIGFFYVLTLFMGLGAMTLGVIDVESGNMSAPLLAKSFSLVLFSIISAIAFATVLGTVSGLIVAASGAVAHDLMDNFMGIRFTDEGKVKAGKIAAFAVGIIAILLGIAFKGMNVAFLVGWAFAVAASANLPSIIMLLFWKKTTAKGIAWSIGVGMTSALGIILTSPSMFVQYGRTAADALHGLDNPGIISIPLSFITLIVVSLLTQKKSNA